MRKTLAMIHSLRITASPFQTHAFANLPYLHVCPSVLLKQGIKSKESKKERKREGEKHESLISLGLVHPNCHVWAPEYTHQPPLSTQSPSLRAGWTASPVPRWMLARSAGLASSCRCRAACFNWQQEKKRLCGVHDIAAFSLSLPLSSTLPFWSALTRLWVHLTTHQLCFSVPALSLNLLSVNVSLTQSPLIICSMKHFSEMQDLCLTVCA